MEIKGDRYTIFDENGQPSNFLPTTIAEEIYPEKTHSQFEPGGRRPSESFFDRHPRIFITGLVVTGLGTGLAGVMTLFLR